MKLRSLRDVDVRLKRVLVRVDFNVPMEHGRITDLSRLRAAMPTLEHLKAEGAISILVSHLGRPDPAAPSSEYKMDEVAKALSDLLHVEVLKLDDCVGPNVEKAISKLSGGDFVLLENVRFYSGEKKNDVEFSHQLASLADLFVNDAFGVAHRAHASNVGVTEFLPSYPGLLMERELQMLSPLLDSPARPLVLIVGGAKIDTKIGLLKNFVDKADAFLVGGGLANTFLDAAGHDVADSLFQPDKADLAREIMLACEPNHDQFYLPSDVVVADEVSDKATALDIPIEDVELGMKILDIGPLTAKRFSKVIESAGTVVWNGPMGLYELSPFSSGTQAVMEAVSRCGGTTILGGGDTLDAMNRFGYSPTSFSHVSTGGGAMLSFLEGDLLPGLEPLLA